MQGRIFTILQNQNTIVPHKNKDEAYYVEARKRNHTQQKSNSERRANPRPS